MKRTSFVLAATTALVGLPAGVASAAAEPLAATVGGITYTVPVTAGVGVTGQCTIVADRWTADYGPTRVYATATSVFGVWTRIRCTVTKNGTTYVDQEASAYEPYVVINAGDGTIPVEGIEICAEIESSLPIDAHPQALSCASF